MHNRNDLQSLSDDELLSRLSNLLKQSRRVESLLVAHLAEVDERQLYRREASSSMIKYCTEVLHLSEPVAYLRITVARASRKHPVVLTMLEDGRIHLSAIGLLAKHLTEENCDELLKRATHKSKREIEVLVAELAPKPDIPPSIRKVPKRRETTIRTRTNGEHGGAPTTPTSSGQSHPNASADSTSKERDKRQRVEPLSRARYKVQLTATAEFRDKLERLQGLMPGVDLAAMLESAVTEKLERLEAKRLGKVKKPRKSLEDADTSPGVRGISAPVRRFVWQRDGGRCTFESPDGRRCPERGGLEFHHNEPYGRGGDRSAENIRLACKVHNLYMAETDYGKEKMGQYRGDMVREPEPLLLLH